MLSAAVRLKKLKIATLKLVRLHRRTILYWVRDTRPVADKQTLLQILVNNLYFGHSRDVTNVRPSSKGRLCFRWRGVPVTCRLRVSSVRVEFEIKVPTHRLNGSQPEVMKHLEQIGQSYLAMNVHTGIERYREGGIPLRFGN